MRPRREDAEGHVIAERTSRGLAILQAARPRLHRDSAMVAGASRAIAGIAVLVLLSSVPLFMVVNKNFLPNDDQSEFEVGLRAPEGTSLEATEIIANRIATRIRQLPGGRIHARIGRRRPGAHAELRGRSMCGSSPSTSGTGTSSR